MTGLRRAFAIAATVACCGGLAAAAAHAVTYPESMGAAGDSITRATDSCAGEPPIECPQNSWSIGTEAAVNSIYQRIRAVHPGITEHLVDAAVFGAKVAALLGQFAVLVRSQPQFVTMEIGANDACTERVEEMTSATAYAREVEASLRYLTERVIGVRILVASVPDVYRLWSLLRGNFFAVATWSFGRICQSMLREPQAMTPEAEARRQSVRARIVEYNEALRRACAVYTRSCQYDGGRFFSATIETGEVSTSDYFHPSVRGQATLAREEWEIFLF